MNCKDCIRGEVKTVIVTGGRDYNDYDKLGQILDFLAPDFVVEGGATGADKLALRWAREAHVDWHEISADWEKHGKAAGPKRNREMLQTYSTAIVVAFPGGRGTENCVKQALELGRLVLRVE